MNTNYIDEKTVTIEGNEITAYKVKHDTNGNPRWVVHFLDLLSFDDVLNSDLDLSAKFEKALAKARTVGGEKYRAKWFGGGIVFQSYCIDGDLKQAFNASI